MPEGHCTAGNFSPQTTKAKGWRAKTDLQNSPWQSDNVVAFAFLITARILKSRLSSWSAHQSIIQGYTLALPNILDFKAFLFLHTRETVGAAPIRPAVRGGVSQR